MIFSTQIFVFVFFPLCLAVYWGVQFLEKAPVLSGILKRIRAKDITLLVFSLGFYMWACFDDVLRLITYIIFVYLLGFWLQKLKSERTSIMIYRKGDEAGAVSLAAFPFAFAVAACVLILVWFKYFNFLTSGWNWLFGYSVPYKSIAAPLGISFITFSAISYLADVYRGNAHCGSFIDCALYITFSRR